MTLPRLPYPANSDQKQLTEMCILLLLHDPKKLQELVEAGLEVLNVKVAAKRPDEIEIAKLDPHEIRTASNVVWEMMPVYCRRIFYMTYLSRAARYTEAVLRQIIKTELDLDNLDTEARQLVSKVDDVLLTIVREQAKQPMIPRFVQDEVQAKSAFEG